MSKRKNNRKPFVGLNCDFIRSEKWRSLSYSGRCIYLELKANIESRDNPVVTFAYSQSSASSATTAAALQELIALGFIYRENADDVQVVWQDGRRRLVRTPGAYHINFKDDVFGRPRNPYT